MSLKPIFKDLKFIWFEKKFFEFLSPLHDNFQIGTFRPTTLTDLV